MRDLLLRDVTETDTLDGRIREEVIKRLEMLKQKIWKNASEFTWKATYLIFERSWF